MSRGGYRHVYVIWDRWKGCRPEVRATIVRDAFAAVKGAEYEKSIAITVAATVSEAADIGLLPFAVVPFKPEQKLGGAHLGGEQLKRASDALMAEGASDVDSPVLPELLFATEQQALEAVSKLKVRVPDLDWSVVVTRQSFS